MKTLFLREILMGDSNVELNDASMKNYVKCAVADILSKIRTVSKLP